MIGGQVAGGSRPSRGEVEARLDALRERVPSRRTGDSDHLDGQPRAVRRDNRETEAETMARLRALEARLDSIGDRP